MTMKDQAVKNMDLTQELAMYIAKHPKAVKEIPQTSSFVAFSASDKELNKENEKLITSLIKEGKKVIVKAVQTGDKVIPWKFFPVTSI